MAQPNVMSGVDMAKVAVYTVATAPSSAAAGDVAYFSDALKASETTGNGTGNLAFYDGSDWIRVDTGVAIGS